VNDSDLLGYLDQVFTAWNQTAGHAPPDRVTVYQAGDPVPDREFIEDERRMVDQVDAADRGMDACASSLARLNELERS
jgi:hypothetical protein